MALETLLESEVKTSISHERASPVFGHCFNDYDDAGINYLQCESDYTEVPSDPVSSIAVRIRQLHSNLDSGTSFAVPFSVMIRLSCRSPVIETDCFNLHGLQDSTFELDGYAIVLPFMSL